MNLFRIFVVKFRREHILGDIDDHRAGATGAGDKKGLPDNPRQLLGPLHQIIVLRDGTGDAGDIGFLEGVPPDIGIPYLPCEANQGDRIHIGRGNSGDEIRRARSRGSEHHPHFSRGSGVAVRSMHRPLLVLRQNMGKLHLVEFIIQRQHRTARIPEDEVDPFLFQAFQHRPRPIDHHRDNPLYTITIYVLLLYPLPFSLTSRKYGARYRAPYLRPIPLLRDGVAFGVKAGAGDEIDLDGQFFLQGV